MPHLTEEKFIEIEKEVVIESAEEEKWRDLLNYLKLWCDSHPSSCPSIALCNRKAV
jgi:hypothetical protein